MTGAVVSAPMVARAFGFRGRDWLSMAAAAAAAAAPGCNRGGAPSGDQPSPSASVISIGVELGTCKDVATCESECSSGSADRCRRLAATYELGQGIAKDEGRAAKLYELACTMKDPTSCVFAGRMHEYAHGVSKNAERAADFYGRACDMKWQAGCYNLAIMFENGRGVPKDRAKAAALYDDSCAGGAKIACDKAKEMREPEAAQPAPAPLPFLDAGVFK